MKLRWAICCAASLLLTCVACKRGHEMPEQRPADLRVYYHEGGGMLPKSERYTVCDDSAVYETRYEMLQNRWRCSPTPTDLDRLWAELLRLDAVNIRIEERGLVQDRGGATIQISYSGVEAQLIDAGSSFVADADAERFAGLTQAILTTFDYCLYANAVPLRLDLRDETDSVAVQNCVISLNGQEMISWEAESGRPLTQTDSLLNLPGRFILDASAQIDGRYISLHAPLEISLAKHHYQIVLKNDTFELHQSE
jgi:hypothetical protein